MAIRFHLVEHNLGSTKTALWRYFHGALIIMSKHRSRDKLSGRVTSIQRRRWSVRSFLHNTFKYYFLKDFKQRCHLAGQLTIELTHWSLCRRNRPWGVFQFWGHHLWPKNWHSPLSSAGRKRLFNDTQFRVIESFEPEICREMLNASTTIALGLVNKLCIIYSLFLYRKMKWLLTDVLFCLRCELDSLFTALRIWRQPSSEWNDELCACTKGQYISMISTDLSRQSSATQGMIPPALRAQFSRKNEICLLAIVYIEKIDKILSSHNSISNRNMRNSLS